MLPLSSVMMSKPERTFGIDPGLATLGWAVIEHHFDQVTLIDCGAITTSVDEPMPQRLQTIHDRLLALLRQYRPNHVSMEKLLFTKNVSSAMAVGQARGVATLAVAEADLPLREFTPTAIKQSVTGDGRADKRQIQQMLKLLLKVSTLPSNNDATDAVAIALCGAQTHDFSTRSAG